MWSYDEYLSKKKKEEEEQENKKQTTSNSMWSYDSYLAKQFLNELPTRLESLQSESQSVYDTYKSRFFDENDEYKNTYRGDTEEAYNTYSTFKSKFDTESQEILSYLDKYGSQLDEKYVTSIKDWLTSNGESFGKIHEAYKYDYDNLSQFKNEDEYKKAVKEQEAYDNTRAEMLKLDTKAAKAEIADMQTVADLKRKRDLLFANLCTKYRREGKRDSAAELAKRDSRIIEYDKQLSQYSSLYGDISNIHNALDEKKLYLSEAEKYQKVVEDAKNVSELMKTPEFTVDAMKGYEQFTKDEEERKAQEDLPWWQEAVIRSSMSSDSPIGTAINNVSYDLRKDRNYLLPNDNWSQEDKDLFGYYYLNNRAKAWVFAEQTNNEINKGLKAKEVKNIENSAMSSVGANLGHQGLAILGNATGFADYLYDILEYNARGTITEKSGVSPFEYAQTVRSATAEHLNDVSGTIDDDVFLLGGKGWGDAYQLGTSVVDSALTAKALGPFGTAVVFFGSAGASAVDDARERGASPEQALAYGTLMGAAEAFAEYIGAEKLLNIGSSKTFKQFIINTLKQGGSEAIEESVTSIAGQFADDIVMADKSQYRSRIRDLMLYKGMGQDEAVKTAWTELAEGIAYDTLSGLASGVIHAAPVTAIQTARENLSQKKGQINSNAITNPLSSYSKEKQNNIKSFLNSTDSKLRDLVQRVKSGNAGFERHEISKVSEREANDLNELLGIDVGGYTHNINTNGVKHILNRHGENGNHDTSMSSDEDIARVGWVLENYDSVEKIDNGGSKEFRTNENIPAVQVRFNKKIDGTYYVVEAVFENKHKKLWVQSAYLQKNNEDVTQASDAGNVANPEMTAKTALASPSSNSTIQQETQNVNIESKFDTSAEGKTINNATGNFVEIEEISSITGGKMTLKVKNEDGTVESVDADNISFSSKDEGVLYSTMLDMGVDAATADAIIGDYRQGSDLSATRYALGVEEAYRYGLYSIPVREMTGSGFSAELSQSSKLLAYNLGKARAKLDVLKAQSEIDKKRKVTDNKTTENDNNGGRENGSENTEVLAGRESVRETDRGQDSQWKQSENSRKIQEWVGDRSNGRGTRQEIRAGSEGWISGNGESQSNILRSRKSFLRDLSRKGLRDTDSAGRKLSKDLQEKFKDTVLKDRDGTILSLYHWTNAEFDRFGLGDIGFHFGTLDAAHERYKYIERTKGTTNSIYKEVYLDIRNPVFIDFDPITWSTMPVAYKLNQQGVISDQELNDLSKLDGFELGGYNSEAATALRELLSEKGYDGILYDNGFEGGISAIAFNADQIYTVAENGIDIENSLDIERETGKVLFDGDKLSLNKIKRESLKGLEILAQVLKKDFHIYESYVLNGKRVYKDARGIVKSAPNGMYHQSDGSIWIDINAGNRGQGVVLHTAAHELTHFIKQWSPQKFRVLSDFLVEKYGEKGISVDELVRKQIQKAKENGRTISYDEAFEEFVADSMTTMLTDGKVIKELYKKDMTLAQKIKAWFDKVLSKLDAIYKNYAPETAEGKCILEMTDSYKKIQSLFTEALSEASENFNAADIQAQKNTTSEGDVKMQLRESTDGNLFVDVEDVTISENNSAKEISNLLSKIVKEKFSEFVNVSGQKIGIKQRTAKEWQNSKNAQYLRRNDSQKYYDKVNSFSNADELLKASREYVGEEIKHIRQDSFVEFARGIVDFKVNDRGYSADIIVGTTKDGKALLYDIVNIEHKKIESASNTGQFRRSDTLSTDSINQNDPSVNTYSMQERKNNSEKHSDRDYSYNTLISKPDMPITEVDDNVKYLPSSATRKSIVDQAIKNASSFGRKNNNGNTVIRVNDIDTEVILSKSSLVHGLDRRLEISAPVILNIGSVLKNAIRVNELTPKNRSASGSYVLIGYAESKSYAYTVRMVVNQYTNEIDTIDVLYAVNTKKETVGKMPGSHGKTALPTVSTISISNLLDYVNKYFPDILPEDALRHYGHDMRPEGELGENALFSDRDYSYNELVSKPDLQGTVISKSQQVKLLADGSIDVDWIVSEVRKKCKHLDNKLSNYYVEVPDIGRNVDITAEGIRHSFIKHTTLNGKRVSSKALLNARVSLELPQVLSNSIEVNRSARKGNIDIPYAHILIGTVGLEDTNGNIEYYAVRSVVEERANLNPILIEAEILGKLKGINAKKIDSPKVQVAVKNNVALPNGVAYTYRIADLLNDVKDVFDDTFSKDVYDHFKMSRAGNDFSKNLLYSDRDYSAVSNRSLLADALESAAQNDIERSKLSEYKAKIEDMDKQSQKLSDLRREIKELSFAKGPRDKAKIRSLQDEAIKTANRIDIYDKQLLRLEAAKPLQNILEREKQKAVKRQKAKDAEILKEYKEKSLAKIEETRRQYQESRKRNVEGRQKTELRNKIKGVVKKLNHLLVHGSKEHNVKLELQDTARKAILAAEQLFDKDGGEGIGECLSKLRFAYDMLQLSENQLAREAYNVETSQKLLELQKEIDDTPLSQLSKEKLEKTYDCFKLIYTTITNVNKFFEDGRAVEISSISWNIVNELKESGLKVKDNMPEKLGLAVDKINNFSWAELKPVYAFERLGSKTLMKLYWDTVRADGICARSVDDAAAFMNEQKRKFGYVNWDLNKAKTFILEDGKEFKLTLSDIMSIYAYSKREQAHDHILKGGFMFTKGKTFTEGIGKNKKVISIEKLQNTYETYRLNVDIISQIAGTLTEEQRNYVDSMQDYLSTVMAEKGNEVSRIMYGIDLFKEKHYFPLKSSIDFLNSTQEALNNTPTQTSLKNIGMAKETMPQASNPIMLEDFEEVWKSHVIKMSQYNAFLIPIENLQKVYNFDRITEKGNLSFKNTVNSVHGQNASQYLNNWIIDLNGGINIPGYKSPLMKRFATFKKVKTAASLSTTIQQYSAIVRATALIDTKHFISPKRLGKTVKLGELYSEMRKYAPVTIVKEIGGFDVGSSGSAMEYMSFGEYDTFKNKFKGFFTDKEYTKKAADDMFMASAAAMDKLGWMTIWSAVKNEVASAGNIAVGSKEFFDACSKRFTEVIAYTQVYDSVVSRSGIMRSKSELNKFATAFMGEPTTSINMLFNAALQFTRAKKGDKVKAFKNLSRTIGAVYVSIGLAALSASFIYALRDDEDEDESLIEKWAWEFSGKFRDEIFIPNMLPYYRDVVSIFQGYTVERPDMSLIADVIDTFKDVCKAVTEEPEEIPSALMDMSQQVAALYGIPLGNIVRDFKAIVNGVKLATDDITPSQVGYAFTSGWKGEENNLKNKAIAAFESGDYNKCKENIDAMIALKVDEDTTEKEARSAVKSSFTRTYKELYLKAVKKGDFKEMNEIRKLLYTTGLYGSLTKLDSTLKDWREEALE